MENLEKNSVNNEQIDGKWNMDEFLKADSSGEDSQMESVEAEQVLKENKEYVYDENIFKDDKEEKITGVDFAEDIENDGQKGYTYTRYLLNDETYYETISDKAFLDNKFVTKMCHELKESLDQFKFPRNYEEIRKFCHSVLGATAFYYTSSVTRGKEDEVTKYSKRVAEIWLDLAKDLSPLWWGKKSKKYPQLEYHGGNPYNMFGQDHKHNYLLENEERKEILKTRELEMRITRANEDTQISSEDILVYLYGDLLDNEREKS
ncbi:MAG: hypothetical protein Q4A25_00905 [Candidatus Saccharibacteria bacterium]|nr:hypothetical protein [Candidatus Saccharibacteria bacterium]